MTLFHVICVHLLLVSTDPYMEGIHVIKYYSNSKDEEVEPMDTTEGDEKKPLEGEEEEEEGSSLDTVPV